MTHKPTEAIVSEARAWCEEQRRVASGNQAPLPTGVQHVESLLARLARFRNELGDKRDDLLQIRGILKPADRVEPVVPMPLGHMVAPAVEWLADEYERLCGGEQRVHRAFADADVDGVDLNALTVAELTALVMGAINGGEPGA